ncbi:MAG TPA: dTDP-4-dehydrorhamnose reductase [Vicinamibacterales bacterium]|nr:dTDP-4-dehydrorhamnose reductase [Vicinamibacterales bacterium]
MNTRRVLVTGAAGRLGATIVETFHDAHVVAHTRSSLDITNSSAVSRAVNEARPDVIINCAAFNDVDGAEDNPVAALAVNAFAPRNLARAAQEVGATFVHYSTDFVFDGTKARPYDESDTPRPQSTYSASKLLGEWFALDAPAAYVLRVESLFGAVRGWNGRKGTMDAIVEGIEAGRDVRVFTDRIVSPSYVPDIAAATRHLILNGAEPGLYHCVNAGQATWHEVAQAAADILRVAPRLVPVRVADVQLKAKRPQYCALSAQKLAAAGFEMPHWRDALARWFEERASAAA